MQEAITQRQNWLIQNEYAERVDSAKVQLRPDALPVQRTSVQDSTVELAAERTLDLKAGLDGPGED